MLAPYIGRYISLVSSANFGKPTRMIDEREIWACANMLLQQHGDLAWYVTAERADELLAQGKLEGYQTFKRILKRIEALENIQPAGSVQ